MKMKHVLPTLVLVLAVTSCGGKKEVASTVAYKSYETECLGSDASGSQRLRVWGEGKDQKSAQENARKRAVEDVVFNHITAGRDCDSWPVIDDPTARRVNHEYFAKFFKDGGKYKKFIKAESPDKDARFIGNDKVVQPMLITVDREGLIKQFTKDKILK